MRRSSFFLLLFLSLPAAARIEVGQQIFFDRARGEQIESYLAFPLTWWGFLAYEGDDFAKVRETCGRLRTDGKDLFALISCGDDIESYEPLLRDWARDEVLRRPKPSDAELHARLRAALARASLPLPPALLSLSRYDPLGTFRAFKQKLEARSPIKLPRREGVFYDEESRRILVPVKFAFPPSDTARTARAHALVDSDPRWRFLGAHAATLANQRRIQEDLGRVTWGGLALLIVGLGTLAFFGRGRLLLLAPVVGVAVLVSALATNLIFGGIHGITLSFGSGIVGLALDYGFHGALNDRPYVRRSNFYGLLTTVGVLVVLMLSKVPLIRQMMFFSTLGIVLAYVGMGWLGVRDVPGFAVAPKKAVWKKLATFVLALGCVAGVGIRPSFDLARFNFQDARDRCLNLWLARRASLVPPRFSVGDEPLGDLLPAPEVAEKNLATWRAGWPAFTATVSEDEKKFFAPFLELGPAPRPPAYLADFTAHGKYLRLYTGPEAPPDATSLREIVESFPQTLAAELKWMIPLALLVVLAIHFHYYRAWREALLPLTPLFTGVGLVAWSAVVFGLPVSFVTLMGCVMLFGLSVDYGIFATDAARAGGPGAWTAILIASMATLGGFLPLVFCRHQVLAQLGATLTIGTFGTMLGAFWGIPSLTRDA